MNAALDVAAKARVFEAMRAAAEQQLAAMRESYADQQEAAGLDQDSSVSVDDISQADEAGDLAGLAAEGVTKAERSLAAIEALDSSPTDVVRPGAIVVLDGDRFVVGVVAAAFECDGETYEGMSADAPILAEIAGKSGGTTFTFAGRKQSLDAVW